MNLKMTKISASTITPWTYRGQTITDISQVPKGAFGFVYLLTNLTNGRKYIGKKVFFNHTTKRLTKKEIKNLPDKRASKYKTIIKESNWLVYTGSNQKLNDDIKNGAVIHREILLFVFSKRMLTYAETKALFCYEVLESEEYYNENILNRFYKNEELLQYRCD